MTIGIRIKDVHFSYSTDPVLHELTLDIEPGEVVGIIGPNGSGKSTLIKAISAALQPQLGKIYFGEQELFKLKAKELAKSLAVVPQDTIINFNFSVWEVVLMGRMPHQGRFASETKEDLNVAKQAMELTNTWHLRDKSVAALSGGERQRVVLARALAQEPQVMLLDEPIANLDLNHQIEALSLIKELNKNTGLTSVIVLHDLNLAARFCQKLILLNKGKVYAAGKPSEVITRENIKAVYGSVPLITSHPLTGVPQISILENAPFANDFSSAGTGSKVHLVCGGGIGSSVMKELVQRGYHVTVGVINIEDTDWYTAKSLELEIAEEAPFSPISESAFSKNKQLVSDANYVILLPIPFGTGNKLNLEVLKYSTELGIPTYGVDFQNIKYRDFTQGKATSLADKLSGAVVELKNLEDFWR
ncbi:iron complex transport system ATP-binding protein [Desulfitispora alkaliphila]|uniref:heme ABC transporter ATP-binding protein n=1 Tax=Desulfitispora alkaliphila TaxID=622674 RepID=UPI003D1935E4